jgi:hypothetical protein
MPVPKVVLPIATNPTVIVAHDTLLRIETCNLNPLALADHHGLPAIIGTALMNWFRQLDTQPLYEMLQLGNRLSQFNKWFSEAPAAKLLISSAIPPAIRRLRDTRLPLNQGA